VTTKASIPVIGGGGTRLLARQLFIELHLLLSGLVLLLGFPLGLDHVLFGLLLGELGVLVVAQVLVLLVLFRLLEQRLGVVIGVATRVDRPCTDRVWRRRLCHGQRWDKREL